MTDPETARLTALMKNEARRLGFDLVGVTTAEPPAHLEVYQNWITTGRHGSMKYLESDRARQRRADPQLVLPGCRTILVAAVNYLPQTGVHDPQYGRVAAYAAGRDYHDVLVDRLNILIGVLEHQVGHALAHRIYTDTGPLLEREFAQRAGLGWIGKNTCLINPTVGSFLFLSEVLLDIDLELDEPFLVDRCGSCTRCIQACPTGCILPDRTIDARKCISYLTIELREAIPKDLRSELGEWLFGCDVCQEVCPWNVRFARPTSDPAFQPFPFLAESVLDRLLGLNETSLHENLAGSPLKRAKRRGLVRNAAVVAGNGREESHATSLGELLMNDPEPLVRQHAAWSLGQIGGPDAEGTLRQSLENEQDAETWKEIGAALDVLR